MEASPRSRTAAYAALSLAGLLCSLPAVGGCHRHVHHHQVRTSRPAPPEAPAAHGEQPVPSPAPSPAPAPPPKQRPQKLVFEGVLQDWERDESGDPVYLSFSDSAAGRELRVTGADKYLASDFEVGKRYRVTFRAPPADDQVRTIQYTLKIRFERVP